MRRRILTNEDSDELRYCAECKVSYTEAQALTDEQKATARGNIGLDDKALTDALTEATDAALAQAKASGEFDGEDGQDGDDGYTPRKGVDYFDGKDGISPTVSVSKVGKVTTITITDVNGTKTATIYDGADGSGGGGTGSGADGEDGIGIASIVQTTKSTADDGVNVMTITLTDGSVHTFEVQNGSKGSKGDDGYTPVKGKDYFDGADGTSCTHSWSGTTLYVTSASGTSSANLKGDKGDKGDSYTLTSADKTAIAEQAAALIDASLLTIIGEVS